MKKTTEPDRDAPAAPSPIRVETALSRYPVHRLARKGDVDIKIRESGPGGLLVRWEVDHSKKHGQPGPLAYKIDTLIVNRRIEEARRPAPRIVKLGSLKELCRELGMAETGGNTNQVKKALFQNALAGVTARTTYRGADGSTRDLEAVFTRYSVILTGEELPGGGRADAVYVLLNEVFGRIIDGAATRPLDYDYLKALAPAPQRFYELLSYRMYAALKHGRTRAELVYSEFCAHAPLKRHETWDRARGQMGKVHRPHRESGYVADVDHRRTADSDGRPDWILSYAPGPRAEAEFRAFAKRGGPAAVGAEPADRPPTDLDVQPLARELIDRGVTAARAEELVRRHPRERIAAQVEHLDWLLEKKPGKVADPGAYLADAIRGDYAAPGGFVPKAERRRREEAGRAAERRAAEEARRERAAVDAERAERERVDAYVRGLSADDRRRLEAEALAEAPKEALDVLRDPAAAKFKNAVTSALLRDRVRALLAGEARA